MTSESPFPLTTPLGYKPATRRYILNFALTVFGVCLVMFYYAYYSPLPILFALGGAAGEMWWRTRKRMSISPSGIQVGSTLYNWEDVADILHWGPVGIPFTPFKYNGIVIITQDGKKLSFNSTYRGFDQLENIIEHKELSSQDSSEWYSYPRAVIRAIRYFLAALYAIVFSIVISFWYLWIIILSFFGYYTYKKIRRSNGSETGTPEDAWMSIMLCLVVAILLFIIWQFPLLQFLLGFIPVLVLVCFPWKPGSFAIKKGALFVGEDKAYPLRHLRTAQEISKFFVLKYWQLTFAQGRIKVFPFLENFSAFKKKLENQWHEIQEKYQGKELPQEEAEIVSPQEEAQKLSAR